MCENGTVQFFTGPASSYTWSGPHNFSSNQQNPVLNNVGSSGQGIYSLTVQDNNACKGSNTCSLMVLLNPVPVVSGDSVCFGENAQLSVSGGLDLWLGPGSFTSNLSKPDHSTGECTQWQLLCNCKCSKQLYGSGLGAPNRISLCPASALDIRQYKTLP